MYFILCHRGVHLGHPWMFSILYTMQSLLSFMRDTSSFASGIPDFLSRVTQLGGYWLLIDPGLFWILQVTIEVVDGPDSEADKDQQPENKPSWSVPSPDWWAWWQRSLSLSRANSGDQDYKYDSTSDDSNFLNPPRGWDRPAPGHRTFETKEQPEYGEFTTQ